MASAIASPKPLAPPVISARRGPVWIFDTVSPPRIAQTPLRNALPDAQPCGCRDLRSKCLNAALRSSLRNLNC